MNKIIAMALKCSGFSWVWEKIDGMKTKLSSIALMLSGASMMLAGLSSIVSSIVACGDMACTIGIFRNFTDNPNAITMGQGFVVFNAGLAGFGIGHKFEKATTEPVEMITVGPVETEGTKVLGVEVNQNGPGVRG